VITFAYLAVVVAVTGMATGQFLPRPARSITYPACLECGQPAAPGHTCPPR
jgi:hypothetical protein